MAVLGPIGVAHPIPNYRFHIPKRFSMGITSISGHDLTPDTPGYGFPNTADQLFGHLKTESIAGDYCGKINKVILGPSSHSSNVDAVEELYVDSGSSGDFTITMEGTPAYSYQSTDPFTVISLGMPEGWDGKEPGGTTTAFSYGRMVSDVSFSDALGYEILNITGSTSPRNWAFYDLGRLMANTKYLIRVNYSADLDSGDSGTILIRDGDGITALGTLTCTHTGAGTFDTESVLFETGDLQSENAQLVIFFPVNHTGNSFNLASVSLTTGIYDATGTTYSTDGFSVFEMYPDLGSVKVMRLHNVSKLDMLASGKKYAKYANKDHALPITRYSISYGFTNIPYEQYEFLFKLLEYQQRGYLLNHFPGLIGLPDVLTGTMQIRGNMKHNRADWDLASFQIIFTEADL